MIDHLTFEPAPAWRDAVAEGRSRLYALADALLDYRSLRRRFEARVGYPLDLERPQSAGEKIQWRKLYDRNPLFPIVADKYRVRGYVAERLGAAAAAELFPRLHIAADRVDQLDFGALPGGLVIKANHASGWNIILRAGEPADHDRLRRICAHWLRRSYDPFKHEWAYSAIPRRVLVEDLHLTEDGGLPDDVKLHVYDGVCRRCQVETGRGSRLAVRNFTPDWGPFAGPNAVAEAKGLLARDRPRPRRLDDMIRVAERLSAGFDYLRVDFLDLGARFLMTELTIYPASGFGGGGYAADVEIARHWRNPRWQRSAAPVGAAAARPSAPAT